MSSAARKAVGTRVSRTRLAQRRRRARFILLGVLAVVLLTVTGMLCWLSYHPAFTVNATAVRGTEQVSATSVQRAVDSVLAYEGFHLVSPRNMLWYPKGEIETALLEAFPRIARVDISLSALTYPNLVVTVAERMSYALWCDVNQTCYYLDESGFVFAEAHESSGLLRFSGDAPPAGSSVTARYYLPNRFAHARQVMELLATPLEPVSFETLGQRDFKVTFADGMYLLGAFDTEPPILLTNLEAVRSGDALRDERGNIEYIDLRFGENVYYKLRSE